MSTGTILRTFLVRVPNSFQLLETQGYFIIKSVLNNSRFLSLSSNRNVSRSSSSRNETPPIELDVSSSLHLQKRKSEVENLREKIGVSGSVPSRAELLHDFKYTLVTKLKADTIEDRFRHAREEDRPLVLLCGWAGANQKNLSKYSDIYNRAGCFTLGYNLPSRFVFTETSEIPHITRELIKVIESENLFDRPVFLHLMSDTGLMVFQGLDLTLKAENKQMNIVGSILDSCPGPVPKASLSRILALSIVNWICCRKDGLNFMGCINETSRLLSVRIIPSIIRHIQGLPVELSLMNNTWAGHHYRDLKDKRWPELFLYSKTDFYLPWQYLEKEILAPRKESGRDIRIVRWEKSPHVSHLRAHRKDYESAIFDFVYDKYFKSISKKC